MLGHLDCFARTELPLLMPTHLQDMSTTLHVVLRSKKTSIRVALDAWDYSPCKGFHECCQTLACLEKVLEAILSRIRSAGDILETDIDAGISRTIG